jgi:hypothetical protein
MQVYISVVKVLDNFRVCMAVILFFGVKNFSKKIILLIW